MKISFEFKKACWVNFSLSFWSRNCGYSTCTKLDLYGRVCPLSIHVLPVSCSLVVPRNTWCIKRILLTYFPNGTQGSQLNLFSNFNNAWDFQLACLILSHLACGRYVLIGWVLDSWVFTNVLRWFWLIGSGCNSRVYRWIGCFYKADSLFQWRHWRSPF